ncbi:MAG: AlkZ-related protein [Candidatus Spyradocola sp.]|jgi:hypothetical protein
MEGRIQTREDLERTVERIGFLPYSGNRRELLFTLEGLTDNAWHDDSETDPWVWRAQVASAGRIAYGKFFLKRSGFVAPHCLPAFVALRRENRPFSDLYAEGLVSRRAKRVYDCFAQRQEWTFPALKSEAGFAGESKEFEAALTELQGLFFLCISGQSRRIGRMGQPYGWPNNDFCTLESRFPEAFAAPMRPMEAEEYLLDCLHRAGEFPVRAARRLLFGGGISPA